MEEQGALRDGSASAQQQASGSTEAQDDVLRSVPFMMVKQSLGCLVCAANIMPPWSSDPDVSMLDPQSSMAGTLCPTKQTAKWGQAPRFLPQCWRTSWPPSQRPSGLSLLQTPAAPNEERTVPLTRKICLYLPSVVCSVENILWQGDQLKPCC